MLEGRYKQGLTFAGAEGGVTFDGGVLYIFEGVILVLILFEGGALIWRAGSLFRGPSCFLSYEVI